MVLQRDNTCANCRSIAVSAVSDKPVVAHGWARVARVIAFTRGNLNPRNARERNNNP